MPKGKPEARRMAVRYRSISSLKPNPQNSRLHSSEQLEQIAASIRAFGFRAPVLIDGSGMIIVGHGRTEAAKLAGLRKVPSIVCDDMTAEQVRAYTIADNRLAELAEWDEGKLAGELKALLAADIPLPALGFTLAELDGYLTPPEPASPRGKLSMEVKAVCPRCGNKFIHS